MMEQKDMLKLVGLLREDMQPALGVTEPGAIALAVAEAAMASAVCVAVFTVSGWA